MAENYFNFGGMGAAKTPYTKRYESVKGQNSENQNVQNSNKTYNFKKVLAGAKTAQSQNIKNGNAIKAPNQLQVIQNKNVAELENGTDIALKNLAQKFESQILGSLWNIMFDSAGQDLPGGLGEELFKKEYISALVDGQNSNKDQLGEIAQSIYDELTAEAKRTGK